ncbi:quinoprotein relay system zinc metallohydrolase 2 [Rhizobium sp. TRM95001]|nr:quinoprotein relay system zinc metallohydrolase 2 [Rhizobium halophilum]MCF6368080.1 quinoprotein relay system zinc metallohydrolase 2 [Rhizobium halophilum]
MCFTRREAMALGFCLCCLPDRGQAARPSGIKDVGNGIFIREAPHEEATRRNRGGIANIGFIIGRDGVLVTDPGGSLADGRWLRSEIKIRTTKRVRYVVMSHVHPDHCLGAAAFGDEVPVFLGHHRLKNALHARGDFYRERLAEVLERDDVGEIIYPNQEVEHAAEVDLGDRIIRMMAHGRAHTDCDLTMLDVTTGTLFPSDLLFVDRVPSLDGSLLGWLAEVERLRQIRPARAVPGHGPAIVAFEPAMAKQVEYLTALADQTRQAIARGLTLNDALPAVTAGKGGGWALYEAYHERNVIQAYKELEWE